MTQSNDNVNARLNELYADYRRQIPGSINNIAQLFNAYCAQHDPSTTLKKLHSALHKLAGSGATFGHTEMGHLARRWEHLINDLINSSAPLSSAQQQEMRALLEQLSQAATLPDKT